MLSLSSCFLIPTCRRHHSFFFCSVDFRALFPLIRRTMTAPCKAHLCFTPVHAFRWCFAFLLLCCESRCDGLKSLLCANEPVPPRGAAEMGRCSFPPVGKIPRFSSWVFPLLESESFSSSLVPMSRFLVRISLSWLQVPPPLSTPLPQEGWTGVAQPANITLPFFITIPSRWLPSFLIYLVRPFLLPRPTRLLFFLVTSYPWNPAAEPLRSIFFCFTLSPFDVCDLVCPFPVCDSYSFFLLLLPALFTLCRLAD